MRSATFLRAGTRFLRCGVIGAVSFGVLATPLRLLPDLHPVTTLKQRQRVLDLTCCDVLSLVSVSPAESL
jgi:hypothetical protein